MDLTFDGNSHFWGRESSSSLPNVTITHLRIR